MRKELECKFSNYYALDQSSFPHKPLNTIKKDMNTERKQTIQTYLDRIEQEREAIARSLEIIKVNREYIEEELAKDNVIKVDIN